MPKKFKPKFYINPKKFEYLVQKNRQKLPQGKHRRVYTFYPWELEMDIPTGIRELLRWNPKDHSISHTVVVDTFDPEGKLKTTVGKATWREAKDNYYKELRDKIREEVKQSIKTSVVIPEPYNPQGLTTIDLSKLTTAGDIDVNS